MTEEVVQVQCVREGQDDEADMHTDWWRVHNSVGTLIFLSKGTVQHKKKYSTWQGQLVFALHNQNYQPFILWKETVPNKKLCKTDDLCKVVTKGWQPCILGSQNALNVMMPLCVVFSSNEKWDAFDFHKAWSDIFRLRASCRDRWISTEWQYITSLAALRRE